MVRVNTAALVENTVIDGSIESRALLISAAQWLDTVQGIGPNKMAAICSYCSNVADLVEAVKSRRLENELGKVAFTRIQQKLVDQNFLTLPKKASAVSNTGRSEFIILNVSKWIQKYCTTTGASVASASQRRNKMQIDFILKLPSDELVAVFCRHNSRGKTVQEVIGSCVHILCERDISKAIALVDRNTIPDGLTVPEGELAQGVELYKI